MLEDKVAFLLQKYLGNYVRGLSKEALKISVWQGDVELSNMQLRPEALNALKLPVKVKAGFLGSVKLKVPWSRLGQEPVLVYLDRILLLAEPATQIEGCSEDAVQEAKKNQVKELEMKLLESQQQLKSEMNTSWLGSLINTIIGNLKLSITNIHIRYEDTESNPGHPFAAALKLSRLSAVTIDDFGKETFATGGALDRIQKSVELESLAFYFDSDVIPWTIDEPWEDLLPSEWSKIFELERENMKEHNYMLEPVTGNAKYTKLRLDESRSTGQALQKAVVNLDSVTLSLSKDGYRDILKMAENFAAFNQRLRYAHYRPSVSVKSDPLSWWKYAYKVVMDETKKASGKFSWEHVLKYARLRKRYIALYASLLKSDLSHMVVDDNKEIEELDRELDIDVILQWRMLAHKFVEQMAESDLSLNKKKAKQSWWSFGRTGSTKDDSEHRGFTEEDWQQLNKLIGYKEGSNDYQLAAEEKDFIHLYLEIHMKHNASKLVADGQKCLAELSCEGLDCNIKTYPEAKVFDLKLGSYKLSSPYGLLAESATAADSLVGIFSYKPFDVQVDWSFVAKSSPCYITYIKESVGQVVAFFKSSSSISQTLALETAAAVQMTIDGVKRTAQEQMSRVLKEQSRFLLNLDIAAPKVTIPTKFYPDDLHATQLLLDLGNLMLTTDDYWECDTSEEKDLYLQFNLVLSDVSAFLVDDDYHWGKTSLDDAAGQTKNDSFLQVIEKCGIVVNFQQVFINSLRGKHVHQVPTEFTGGVQNVLAVYDAGQYNSKVVEDTNALILLCDDNEDLGTWQKRLQGAIYRASGPATISSISEISSPAETTKGKSYDIAPTLDVVYMERLFVTGVLDELRVCFSCSFQSNQSLKKMLISHENRLFEFRAIGGQVELSMREKNIFIGTVLKSLEIEDQFCHEGGKTPRYIARSFINSEEATALHNLSSFTDIGADKIKNNSFKKSDSEKFFEALDDLDDLVDNFSGQDSFPSPKLSLKPPSFCRIPGLTPDAELQTWSLNLNRNDMLDSFVKAQIVIYDQSSSHYNNLDNKVMVTLATLSFFFHRPTILATLEFFNAINISEENDNADEIIQKTPLDRSSQSVLANEANTTIFEESKVKGLLGSGKTRIIFHLTLDMAMAQIFLMNEDGTSFATLSQNNLLTDIEVFPSSFSIKAALGNLKISDDSVPSNHPYFWVCDMRDPGGSSFVELNFSSFSTDDDDYMGYDYSLTGQFSEVRIVYLNRFVQEVISYFVGLLPSNAEGVVKLKDQVTNSEKWVSKSEIEGSPAIKLDLSLSRPIILMPRHTRSLDYLELDVLQITVHNSFQWLGEDKTEMSAVHQETMFIKPPFASMQSTC
ncbi:vacuolar protein [Musa troglodytarum]|uniref:Vacuolar protein n=1 Tax=Musa troglodytarum TaxID=320322 RepID=A0A9E7HR67_9LILI|nr:vacuolar protein [Musa troglodytarum]